MRGIVTTSSLESRVATLAREVEQAHGPVSLVCKDPAVNTRIFAELAGGAIPDAIAVDVPRAVDQVERVLLSLGAALGADTCKRLSEALETSGASLAPALGVLDKAMNHRGGTLVIRGWDGFGDVGSGDTEIRRALRERSGDLRRWLVSRRGVFLSGTSMGAPIGRTIAPFPLDLAPSRLYTQDEQTASELWSRCGNDSILYDLRLAQLALDEGGEQRNPPDDDPLDADAPLALLLRLRPQIARLLRALALHGRPLRRTIFRSAPLGATEGDIDLGAALGLWFPVGDQLLVHPRWQSWCLKDIHERDRRACHRDLATAFAAQVRPDDPNASRWGLFILEAHRHFVETNDLAQAARYARYGTTLLIARARGISLDAESGQEFAASADLYGKVIELQGRQPTVDPVTLHAYAKHYWHFNRARAGLETIQQTVEGYRESVELWPEQALFWSRYIRALFIDNRRAEAMQALADAQRRVPAHRDKDGTLTGRTVDRLLDRLDRVDNRPDLLLDAVEVWDGVSVGDQLVDVASKLATRLAEGWRTTDLSLTSGPGIAFHRPVQVRIYMISEEIWQAEVAEAQLHRRGANPLAALQALITAMRARCAELIAAFTHTLDGRTRLEKQNLLGCVDVVRSGLDARGPSTVTFLGTLRLEPDQTLALHTHGSRHLVFELPDELADDKVASDQLWIARVAAGAGGVPSGPILELKPAYQDEDAIVERWNRRFAHGG